MSEPLAVGRRVRWDYGYRSSSLNEGTVLSLGRWFATVIPERYQSMFRYGWFELDHTPIRVWRRRLRAL